MKFQKLAEYLTDLEKTDSRNEMTVKLADLFIKADQDEVREMTYLLLGGLRPKFDSLEFNLAEKQVTKAIGRAFDKEEGEVKKIYKDVGDLGVVVESLDKQEESSKSVKEVYDKLVEIAKDDGQGSQDRKIDGLAELIKEMDGLSNRYVVRMVMGKLRLGFSDKTILDALSWFERGDKTAKKELESGYQVRPDVGYLVEQVKKHGIKKTVQGVEMELGVPISPMLCQRLKSADEMVKKMGKVAVEPKFDGTRVQIHFDRDGKEWVVRTFTRNLDENSHMFPELNRMGEHVGAKSLVLDAEAVGHDPQTGKMLPFQMTITRKRKHGVEDQASRIPLKFYVFDVMYKDGESLVDESYLKRREILDEAIKDKELLVVDKHWETDDGDAIRSKHEELLRQGLEGVIVKKLDSKYVPGRTGWRWVKMKEVEESHAKLSDTVDAVVMGYYRGRGKRTQFGVGAFLAGVRSGEKIKTITKVGTGLTDEQFRELKNRLDKLVAVEKPEMYEVDKNLEPDVWVDPELVVELAADEVTKSPTHTAGVALRFPRLIKFRDDKGVRQATSVDEVKKM